MKKIKFLIIVCIFLIIAISGFLLFNPTVKAQKELNKILVSDEMDDDLILPKGLYKLGAVYKGNLTTEIICKSYNHLATTVIPKYYKQCSLLNDDELKKLYEKNKNTIYIELGYENYDDFYSLIQELKKLSGETLTFESYELNDTSLKNNKDYCSMYLYIKYENNDEIVLNSYVSKNKKNDSTSIVLKADVDLDWLEEEKNKLEENNITNSTVNNTVTNTTNNTVDEL
jgi:hypothetical protein